MNYNAKYAFFYGLSLIALVFVTTSVGIISWQLLNKFIVDIELFNNFSLSAVRYALSALLVSAPVYFLAVWRINKGISKGELSLESGVRRWLTYFILLVASVVILGFLIGVFNNYLEGELELRFILKFLSVCVIAGVVIWYYLYDILRSSKEFDGVMRLVSVLGVLVVLSSFVAGLLFIESPKETRLKKQDSFIVEALMNLERNLELYHNKYGKLPADLDVLIQDDNIPVRNSDLLNPITEERLAYKVVSDNEYEVCASFSLSNKEKTRPHSYPRDWIHEAGEDCFVRSVDSVRGDNIKILNPLR